MQEKIATILEEVEKVIVGKKEIVEKLFMAILSEGHVLLEDVPGVGKTTLALSFSKVLGMDFSRITFTIDTMPSDITGFTVYNRENGSFVYNQGPVMTNLLLADEINRTSSRTQSALLEVMEEKQVTVGGTTYALPEPFVVLATQNPVGSAGTQLLPNSQLDRFMIRLHVGYPDFQSQVSILKERHNSNPLDDINCVISVEQLQQMQQAVKEVYVSDDIYAYITRLAEATRDREQILLGVSPRGALALCRMSKAYAFVTGRDYVIPEDVKAVFLDVCAHRIKLSAKARMEELREEDCLNQILAAIEEPELKR